MSSTASAYSTGIISQQFSGSRALGMYAHANKQEHLRTQVTTASAILEVKRLSGLTWDELSTVFGVSPKALHNWANGSVLSASNEASLRRMLSVVRFIDRKDSDLTRGVIYLALEDGTTAFDLLHQGDFDRFREVVSGGPVVPALSPLSQEENLLRKPPAISALMGVEPELSIKNKRANLVLRHMGWSTPNLESSR